MDNRDIQKAKLLNSKAVAEIVEKYINKGNPVTEALDINDDGRVNLEDVTAFTSVVYDAMDVNNDGKVDLEDLKQAFIKISDFFDFMSLHLNKPTEDIKYSAFQRENNINNQVSDIETGPIFTEEIPPSPPSVKEDKKKKRNWLKRFLFPEDVKHVYIHHFPIGPL